MNCTYFFLIKNQKIQFVQKQFSKLLNKFAWRKKSPEINDFSILHSCKYVIAINYHEIFKDVAVIGEIITDAAAIVRNYHGHWSDYGKSLQIFSLLQDDYRCGRDSKK